MLLPRLKSVLAGISHEIIIADDASKDGTADEAERLGLLHGGINVLRRTGTPGLSRSILDGLLAAQGHCLAVMDADMQHDECLLPAMVDALRTHNIAIGSRYVAGGGCDRWSLKRRMESRLAAAVTRFSLRQKARDPLAGFFAIRRETLRQVAPVLSLKGWKILLEILVHARDASVVELPYVFKPREHGETKMNPQVIKDWLAQLSELRAVRRNARPAVSPEVLPEAIRG